MEVNVKTIYEHTIVPSLKHKMFLEQSNLCEYIC